MVLWSTLQKLLAYKIILEPSTHSNKLEDSLDVQDTIAYSVKTFPLLPPHYSN